MGREREEGGETDVGMARQLSADVGTTGLHDSHW